MASVFLNSSYNIRALSLDCTALKSSFTIAKPSIVFFKSSSITKGRTLIIRASENQHHDSASGGGGSGAVKILGLSLAECEAAIVAGNVPEAPPVPPKPAAPRGTPIVQHLSINRRPRRNRRSPVLRPAF